MIKKKTGILLLSIYIVSFVLSNGPGLLLINRAKLIMGFPPVYLWAILFFTIQFACLVLAYFFVWKEDD